MSSIQASFIRKVVSNILNVLISIFIIILFIIVSLNIQQAVSRKDYTNFFGYSIFEMQDSSMEPTITRADCVLVKLTDEFTMNDIITYEKDGTFITSRIKEIYKENYLTGGDSNGETDTVYEKNMIGKVVKILPRFVIFKIILNPILLSVLIILLYIIKRKFKNVIDIELRTPKENLTFTRQSLDFDVEDLEYNSSNDLIEEDVTREKNDIEETVVPDDSEELDKTLYFRMVPVDEADVKIAYTKTQSAKNKRPKTSAQKKKKKDLKSK